MLPIKMPGIDRKTYEPFLAPEFLKCVKPGRAHDSLHGKSPFPQNSYQAIYLHRRQCLEQQPELARKQSKRRSEFQAHKRHSFSKFVLFSLHEPLMKCCFFCIQSCRKGKAPRRKNSESKQRPKDSSRPLPSTSAKSKAKPAADDDDDESVKTFNYHDTRFGESPSSHYNGSDSGNCVDGIEPTLFVPAHPGCDSGKTDQSSTLCPRSSTQVRHILCPRTAPLWGVALPRNTDVKFATDRTKPDLCCIGHCPPCFQSPMICPIIICCME